MKFAVIAAGDGSRLVQEGSTLPKPLVRIGGQPMIGRLLQIMHNSGRCDGIAVIVRPSDVGTIGYLESVRQDFGLDIVTKATPSSMHSLYELSPLLRGGRFCATTVDTVFREDEFLNYIEAFEKTDADCLMGVTAYIDDEKPLYVSADADMHIDGYYDTPSGCSLVSAGIYGLCDRAIDVLERCVRSGQTRMRAFQRQLVAEGLDVRAWKFGKVVDVDHISDIAKAEELLDYVVFGNKQGEQILS